jgi:hypothetical protein
MLFIVSGGIAVLAAAVVEALLPRTVPQQRQADVAVSV